MPLEESFDAAFTASLALREKQIQQSYRPIIGIHKWFARRPGTVFRNLLLAEFNGAEALDTSYFRAHQFQGVIADPFMGGGTPLIEANRLGFHVIGTDINPMAFWIVRQELEPLDDQAFSRAALDVARDVAGVIEPLYRTTCRKCGDEATAKYFLWVKTQACPACGLENDLFPGYLLAEATRHPKHVLACADCQNLVELEVQPRPGQPTPCPHCGGNVRIEGPARRNAIRCRGCHTSFRYPPAAPTAPPKHRMWAIEYHCAACKPSHSGRFFKAPDEPDRAHWAEACERYAQRPNLPIPDVEIPDGDESARLHRWGYRRYADMFNDRQLLGLGTLLGRIGQVEEPSVRHALLTVFSDSLRYQNLLCRYDTYALKCQDIFSVHGFPVGLVQCENNLLGIPGVGSGAFLHFIEKYRRAKAYCENPFETRQRGATKQRIPIVGERVQAALCHKFPGGPDRQAYLQCASATDSDLPPESLDGVFTDPPYFDNVQYAELIDFCYVWLRTALRDDFGEFTPLTTRTADELTGNANMGRGLEHFTGGLSQVFTRFANALKPNAPFVFTYHHNEITAYAPLVVAMLDAGLYCTSVLPVPAEMEASLHINNTTSSIVDSVFVARRSRPSVVALPTPAELLDTLNGNCRGLVAGGVRVSKGDVRCLFSGHVACLCVQSLSAVWNAALPLAHRLDRVQRALISLVGVYSPGDLIADVAEYARGRTEEQLRLFDAELHRASTL